MGRKIIKPARIPTTRKTQIKNVKPQIRLNKTKGTNFENKIFRYLTEYLKNQKMTGLVWKMPEGKNINQWMDILIDSKEFGYCGIECKSINDAKLENGKVYTRILSRKNEDYGHQLAKQHFFLKSTGRYGLIAIEFSARGTIVLVPHQFIFNLIENKVVFITVDELLKVGFNIEDNNASLKVFIRKYCRTDTK